MTKSIGYAYPTSGRALELCRGDTGCYYIEYRDKLGNTPDDIDGPYDTIGEAELVASLDTVVDWARQYKQYPLHGSMFSARPYAKVCK